MTAPKAVSAARIIDVCVLLACVALVVFAIWSAAHAPVQAKRPKPRVTPLGALPARSGFVLTLDVPKLRQSMIGRSLLESRELRGLSNLNAPCADDPLRQVETMAIVVPSIGSSNDQLEFGVAAFGALESAPLVECGSTAIRNRGGAASVTRIGSFTALRDRERPEGEIAVRDGGPLLVGDGSYLRDMIDSADGRAPTLLEEDVHPALRRAVGEDGAVVATWIVPEGLVERLAGTKLARLSPLSHVRAVALRVDVSPRIALQVVLGCVPREACAGLLDSLEQVRQEELLPLLDRELGQDAADRLALTTKESQVRLSLVLEEREASALVEGLVERLERRSSAPAAAPSMSADEIVRPKR